MSDSQLSHAFSQSLNMDNRSLLDEKAKVIGLYGIPGSGKTFLLDQLKQGLDHKKFAFYEGSEVIATLVPGGLEAFDRSGEHDKTHWRRLAIDSIRDQCTSSSRVAVVTGHLMFWPEANEEGNFVHTKNDLATYTHILYLDVPVQVIEQRCRDDARKVRPHTSTEHLQKWQQAEKAKLRSLCREHGILFSLLTLNSMLPTNLSTLLRDFSVHTEAYNLCQATSKLDQAVASCQGQLQTMLVLDADRTLAAEDAGILFWRKLFDSRQEMKEDIPLKDLFSGPLGYSYKAFRQAVLLYEEAADDQAYDVICQQVASAVTVHPEFVSLLHLVAHQGHIGAVIVSCGLGRVWEKILEREGLSKTVKVIAGGRIADGIVVTAAVKAAMVSRLQHFHQLFVWAFGDSPLDLEMLKVADRAVVVVGNELTRSKTMDAALTNAIDHDGLRAIQAALPSNAPPRLSTAKLPLVDLTRIEFISDLLRRRGGLPGLPIFLATDRGAAKLLATPMRDAGVAGPALRKAHRQVGWYLAYEFLTRIVGIEECPIPHVLGHRVSGYRLMHEQETTIVALMRAGEPMASGVSKACPLAMFVHASHANDIKPHHVQGRRQIVLVDSVVNSGKTVIEFVQTIRNLDGNIRIVIVAGVVQAKCISPKSPAYKTLYACGNVSLIALRLSDTKFTGSGTTDTGNRLFNTTHLS